MLKNFLIQLSMINCALCHKKIKLNLKDTNLDWLLKNRELIEIDTVKIQ